MDKAELQEFIGDIQTMLEDINDNLEIDEIDEDQYSWLESQLNIVRDSIPLI